jgi:hypothetical protein
MNKTKHPTKAGEKGTRTKLILPSFEVLVENLFQYTHP